jgi:hypothetical protein
MSYGEAVACMPLRRRHARKVETVPVPLFPRYIFTILDRGRDRGVASMGPLGSTA